MVYTLAAALLLAQGALAALPPFPTPNALANVVHAASTTDAGLLACATVEAVESYCVNYYDDFTALPEITQAACLCCLDEEYLAAEYGSCADYISASYFREYSSEYTLQSAVQAVCASEGNICAAGASTPTPTTTTSRSSAALSSAVASATVLTSAARGSASASSRATTSAAVVDQEPPACTSAAYIIESCSQLVDDFTDLPGSSQASCICYTHATYTTGFDDLASGCAVYVETASPAYYSDWAALTTFCEDYPAETTTASKSTSIFGGSGATRTSSSSTTAAQTQTVTVQGGGGGSTPTTSVSHAAAAGQGPVGNAAASIANLMFFIASLFMAI